MSSLPAQRPASQRRASPPSESSASQKERANSFSGQSVDSQTLLLNSPPSQSATSTFQDQKESPTQTAAPQQQDDDDDPRRCWICFNDETEDDETTSEWRSPCACSLVAHETCLLDWIADMEAPTSGRRAGTTAGKVLCPQCKGEIVIKRHKSYVVEAVRSLERLVGSLRLPGFALVTGTALYSTLTLSGTATIYQIFGTEDALQILGPLYETPNAAVNSVAVQCLDHLRQHWRLDLGLPLIPAVLVASRTTFADSFLPFLPLIFFVSSGQPGDEMLQLQWPPSAAFTFATLPYLRGFYNAYYERFWLPREQKWLREIQPRQGEDANVEGQVQDQGPAMHNAHDGEVIQEVEIELDFDIFGGWGEGEGVEPDNNPAHPIEPHAAGPIDAPPQDDTDTDTDDDLPDLVPAAPQANPLPEPVAAPAPNIPMQPAAPRPRRIRHERAATFSTASLADTILGALIFPTIAAAMGEILRHTLPTDWVTPPSSSPAVSWLGGWIKNGGKAGGHHILPPPPTMPRYSPTPEVSKAQLLPTCHSPSRDTRSHKKHQESRRRSRSPHGDRDNDNHRYKRRRTRSPVAKTVALPYKAKPLTKRDYEAYKPLFQSYLDIQKQIQLDELDEREAKGRWKSFVSRWNRGDLARSWYDPSMLKTAQDTLIADSAADAQSTSHSALQQARKQDRTLQKARLEDLVPRADAGTRERQLEKKCEVTSTLQSFRDAKEAGDVEVAESDLMGDDGVDFA
ncbi:RING finger domain containing protein [Pyrenophora tritici-repentis]|nr:RING finger domain containing protein [Pyrenophora tritici-repentis]